MIDHNEKNYCPPQTSQRPTTHNHDLQALPLNGTDDDKLEEILRRELREERDPSRNLATFGTTWMEPHAQRLMIESFGKNLINRDAYPNIAKFENRCIQFLANLWHCPEPEETFGVATTGSSEAAILAGIALKHRWESRRNPGLANRDNHLNIVLGANVHVCWKKLCLFLDIEPRYVPCQDNLTLDVTTAVELVDENTIGVVAVLGNSYNGAFDDVALLNRILDLRNRETDWATPIHVDAASGGFVAPFIHTDLKWDFRLNWVVSINASGHKYGLVYPSVGWLLWRDPSEVAEELIFRVDYLGGEISSFSLSFSRPSSQIVAQYYTFLRNGVNGYQAIIGELRQNAEFIASQIEKIGPFELITRGTDIPVISWCINDEVAYTLFDLEQKLANYGWQVPAYQMPLAQKNEAMMRIVVKVGFDKDMIMLFLADFQRAVAELTA